MEYNVYGTLSLNINVDTEAASEEEAIEEIKQDLIEYFHLKTIGSEYPSSYEMNINCIVYDEE